VGVKTLVTQITVIDPVTNSPTLEMTVKEHQMDMADVLSAEHAQLELGLARLKATQAKLAKA
jgi:hypothetical protein